MSALYVVKIGGNIIDDDQKLSLFLDDFARLEAKKILVHGGGKLATTLAEKLGVAQQLIDGRRMTDAQTLKIVTMVYGGLINKNIVAQLQSRQCNALGLCGADGNIIQAHQRKHPTIDFGFVGDVDRINTHTVQTLLDSGLTLVFAPLTCTEKGQLLNTNADTIAQELAKAMSALYEVELIFSFERNGVLRDIERDDSVIDRINPTLYSALKKENQIFAGMIPKIDNAFSALQGGVRKVIIGNAELLNALVNHTAGTIITNE